MEDDKQVFTGEVIFFNSKTGYGFILWEKQGVKQKDIFLHYSDINMEGYKTVNKGQKVSFNIGENIRGQDKAINVTVIV
jgi:CspA family cold shock protein